MKSIFVKIRWFLLGVIVLFCVHYQQRVTAQSNNIDCQSVEDLDSLNWLVTDTSFVWNPEVIYVIFPDIKLEFKLPYEKDQSGVANLLFQDITTGEFFLLDTIKNDAKKIIDKDFRPHTINAVRKATMFQKGRYDAILLYNNGKYVRCNDVLFEKGVDMVVDMKKLSIQPSDTESQYWLTFRKFITSIGMREFDKNGAIDSERKIRGYIFDEYGYAFYGVLVIRLGGNIGINAKTDGYFEIYVEDYQTLKITSIDVEHYINIKSNSGLFFMTKVDEAKIRDLDKVNVTTGPLIKVR